MSNLEEHQRYLVDLHTKLMFGDITIYQILKKPLIKATLDDWWNVAGHTPKPPSGTFAHPRCYMGGPFGELGFRFWKLGQQIDKFWGIMDDYFHWCFPGRYQSHWPIRRDWS